MMGVLALAVIASVIGLLLRWAGSPAPHGSGSGAARKDGMSGSRNVVADPALGGTDAKFVRLKVTVQ